MDDMALIRTVLLGFPLKCRTFKGHVHVVDPQGAFCVCLSLEKLEALVPVAEKALERSMTT